MNDVLRRAWDALDTFKQAYPENWNQEDEQVLEDLMKADLKLSGVRLKWVGLTDEEIFTELERVDPETKRLPAGLKIFAHYLEARLKEKNT